MHLIDAFKMYGRSWRQWLGFELIYRLVSTALGLPLLKLAIDTAMKLTGYAYLTFENITAFLLTPVCIIFALIGFLVLAYTMVIEVAGLHYTLDLADQGIRPHLRDAFRYGFMRANRSFRLRNILAVPYTQIVVPFLGLGVTAGLVQSLNLPEYMYEFSNMNVHDFIQFTVLPLVGALALVPFLFAIIYFVADDISFFEAGRRSWKASWKHYFGNLVGSVFGELVAYFVIGLVMVVAAVVLARISSLFLPRDLYENVVGPGISVFAGIFANFFLVTPISYAILLALLRRRTDAPQPSRVTEMAPSRMPAWAMPALIAATCAVSLIGGAYFIQLNFLGTGASTKVEGQDLARHIDVTAHRGGSYGAPENTMAAMEQAKIDGADICEIDVQMSKDGQIFVSHDTNFLRVSRVDKNAWELTYDEILELDARAQYWVDRGYEMQRYPLLDEVITWAEESDMLLNIELKPTGHETDFEKAVADIVNAHDFGSRCIVTSQMYDTVARMKDYAPEATCTYVTKLAYGDVCQLEAADAFSIEALNATPMFVSYLHAHNKTVLCWLVNSETTIRNVVGNGVDNVITDDVPLARSVVDSVNEQTPAERMITRIASIFGVQ